MNDNSEVSQYNDSADILLGIAENQQTELDQYQILIDQNNAIIEQNNQIITLLSYVFVVLLSLIIGKVFIKVLSVIDSA